MRIAVIGAGAMGSIYGGHLAQKHEVYLVDTNQSIVDQINQNGLKITEDGTEHLYHPLAVTSTDGLEPMDLIIIFVKALFSEAALSGNTALIGSNTYLMTLQNGSGHEDILSRFVPLERIIIGTTEDNGAILAPGSVRRGGTGKTNLGMLTTDSSLILPKIKEALDSCGFQSIIHENIQQLIWDKLFTNISLSAVTGVLQVPMGYIASNEFAWKLTSQLIHEAVTVAKALGLDADEANISEKVHTTSVYSPEGITSICADLKAGRKTEVDTISGSVIKAAAKYQIPVPTHEAIVMIIHAMEGRSQ